MMIEPVNKKLIIKIFIIIVKVLKAIKNKKKLFSKIKTQTILNKLKIVSKLMILIILKIIK